MQMSVEEFLKRVASGEDTFPNLDLGYAANLDGANLVRANLVRANLDRASLRGANLGGANLGGANLYGAKINWCSHTLLSEILWRAAGDDIRRQMLAAFIGRKHSWCWKEFIAFEHSDKEWALDVLATWVQDDDDAPALLRRRSEQLRAVSTAQADKKP